MDRGDTAGPVHPSKFLAGAVCLDFTNSLSGRMDTAPVDRIAGYDDLVAWAAQGGLLTDALAEGLRDEARRRPEEAAAVLARAVELRAAIHTAFVARAGGGP